MNDMQNMLNDIKMEVHFTSHLTGKDSLDKKVMTALKTIPRHEFLPDDIWYFAYENKPLPIGWGQTISQPYIVALMTDLLNTKASDIILEIGTGSGYQSAILSQLVKQVYSVEIIKDLSKIATQRLHNLGYKNIEVHNHDGYYGWPEHAPYDGIIITAAVPHVPPPLIEQLKIGANMVVPIGTPHNCQELMIVRKKTIDEIETRKVLGVSFVPLTNSDHFSQKST
jgi:protein-L-isoaspartate(D-aspartate) O-methyltransferase